MFQTTFSFTLPRGYLDGEGNLHRSGTMRLAKAIDEIVPMKDPRVKANPAYATVLILSRVVTQLGALEAVSPRTIEDLYAIDLNYLYELYQEINETKKSAEPARDSQAADNREMSDGDSNNSSAERPAESFAQDAAKGPSSDLPIRAEEESLPADAVAKEPIYSA